MGFEPTTASLEGWNSTTELRPHYAYIFLILNYCQKRLFSKQENFETSYVLYKLYVQPAGHGGQARVRTLEADGSRFTVCPR